VGTRKRSGREGPIRPVRRALTPSAATKSICIVGTSILPDPLPPASKVFHPPGKAL
jgi:hypothetical protein